MTVVERFHGRTDAERLESCHKSILEMIRTGTTCVNDITSTGMSFDALDQVGMRGIVSAEFFHPVHEPGPDMSEVISRVRQFQNRF